MPAQTVIKIRRDSSENWELINPVLQAGEIAIDLGLMKFKVGNGVQAWDDLEYASDPESVVAAVESYADSAADAAETAANSYSDSLAVNYDPAGAAASALADAEDYADSLASNYDAAGTAASAVTEHNDDTTSVHGIADTTLLLTTAGGTLTGYLTLHADPIQAFHAATKEYVDNVATGVVAKPSVKAATTANLVANYSNGTSGVGATLTATTNGAFPLIDGATVTTANGDRGVLVKNQTNAAHNGRYNLTTQGSSSAPWVLTRCGLCDTSDEIPGMYVFVQDGDTNKGKGYVALVADPDTFVIGTDAINYTQFSGAGTYVAGNGLVLNDNAFAIDDSIVAPLNSPTFTGDVDFTGATVTGLPDSGITTITGNTQINVSGTGSSRSISINGSSITDSQISSSAQIQSSKISVADATTSTATEGVGYRGLPQVSTFSSITLNASHAGKHILATDNITITFPTNAQLAFPIGTTIVFIANQGRTVTMQASSPTSLVLANGTTASTTRTLGSQGVATAIKIFDDTWIVSGNGLT